MSETGKMMDLFREGVQGFPPRILPEVNEKIVVRIKEGETVTVTVQDETYTFQEGEPEDAENIVEVTTAFMRDAMSGKKDARTVWGIFAEIHEPAMVPKGNAASLVPLMQSMNKAYDANPAIREKIDKL